MNKFGNFFKPLTWFMALLLAGLVAGCGGDDDAAPAPSAAGAVCTGADCVDLGTAGNFVILSQTGITNTGTHGTAITGNIGASPVTAAAMDGVFCSGPDEITGTIIGVDAAYTGSGDVSCFAGTPADKTTVDTAVADAGTAFGNADAKISTTTDLGAGDITGLTIPPGVYNWTTGVALNGNVTLSGSGVWVFQIAGGLTVANGSTVTLAGGANATNIFWRTAGVAALGTTADFKGIILSDSSVTVATGATVVGRLYAGTAVTLDANTVTRP